MKLKINKSKLNFFLEISGYLLFFLMIVYPMVYNLLYFKAILFGINLFIIFNKILFQKKVKLNTDILTIIFIMIITGLFFSYLGSINNSLDGVKKEMQVYVIWPIIYFILIININKKILINLIKIILISTIFIGVYSTFFILIKMGILPNSEIMKLISFDATQVIGKHQGFLAIRTFGLNSLPFLVPFTITTLIFKMKNKFNFLSSKLIYFAFLSGIAVTLISGRRAIWLVTVLCFLLIIIFNFLITIIDKKRKKISISYILKTAIFVLLTIVLLIIVFNSIYEFNFLSMFNSTIEEIVDLFNSDQSETYPRKEQFFELINKWSQKPFIGFGFGAFTENYIRSKSQPWSYELYYVALLMKVGIIGFGIYMSLVLWIYLKGFYIIYKNKYASEIMFSTLIALTTALIANATNPYLLRFDGLWVLFLPLAIINVFSKKEGD